MMHKSHDQLHLRTEHDAQFPISHDQLHLRTENDAQFPISHMISCTKEQNIKINLQYCDRYYMNVYNCKFNSLFSTLIYFNFCIMASTTSFSTPLVGKIAKLQVLVNLLL